uniref:Uncharacterized protein n=1 Tax=Anguilla anguilla TaxID=7936 RepID=A0A0E9PKC3_ANGAN
MKVIEGREEKKSQSPRVQALLPSSLTELPQPQYCFFCETSHYKPAGAISHCP